MSRVRAFARAAISALALAVVAGGVMVGGATADEAPPRRVVSMNLCTDQLAMLLAAPGQLISVTYLAQDPSASAMAEEAHAFPANRGLAEEIFLLEPDLVIAGTYTTRATVGLLRRLGVPVVEFAPANGLTDIGDRLAQMGAVLGREDAAARVLATFNADLAAARITEGPRPEAATYYANSYTSGTGTLASSVIEAAGLSNLGAALGIEGGGRLALETLVTERPDLVITGRRFETPALAQEVLAHPALAALQAEAGTAPVADRDWICGTPRVLAAIRRLVAARDAVLDPVLDPG
ncbi:MAG: ABC transporter substrate-binding protein [Pseudomonadota bacterium]